MSDEPSDAHKLIAEVILRHQPNEWGQHDGWWECCCQHGGPLVPWTPEHVAAEVDKALGGLNRTWAAVFPDGSYMTPYHEVWNFHPNKSARELAEGDVAEYEDTTLKAQWVSGWTVTE
ncbi:Uncharacterised protein [Mycobacteroides abscessus subsp. abscessus]|uniref:Uncharacterized protein n=1 Tax=Mycobacteroides abscessus TaxID=36809 RepID=A0AB33T1X8_9MYCO|nr:hypothetical protein [Mycobacteroides abscessus]MDO3086307.1 hypothetical protein [Mycobacteroides abscessus subsp. abscessus]RIU22656.1 hypothetical protein D2E92_23845 [Mycobacteroides abscessus]CPT12362.1 Hypothetical protein ERS075527_01180 [Mycobacteroides abscessus]CPT21040.1 Hypothetical protein ERS075531_01029 [Mycobacteroides abscessus]CPT25636.1 Hypothetical protein ERS075532_01379 [Mycobacteroides abscessus]